MAKGQKIKVQIDGMNFIVVGNDNEEYVKMLAADLNERINKTENSNYRLNDSQVLILTALNILDEKEKLDKKYFNLSQTSEDLDSAKENIELLEDLRAQVEEEKKLTKKYKDLYENAGKDLKYYKEINENQRHEISEIKSALEDEQESIKKLVDNIEELKSKTLKDQMIIVDLNKEISILKNDEEK